jgi:3-oxoadipate enol-lactonase
MIVHHVVDGPQDAPVLVLSSSLGTTHAMWEPQVAALRERFRLVRYDRRGHGASPVPPGPYSMADLGGDVLALLDHLGIERAHFAGLSIGGMVGIWLGAHAPERIDRLALLCTTAAFEDPAAWADRAALVREAGSPEPLADVTLGRWFTDGFREQHPEVVAALRAGLLATPAEGYAGCCEAIGAMDQRADLGRIGAPTLVIAGDEDPSTPPAMLRAIAEAIPGARYEELAPARHIANVEQAERVTALFADHFDTGATP